MNRPRIAVIGNYAPDCQESMRRFSAMLAAMFEAEGARVSFVVPPVTVGRLARRSTVATKWLGYVDKFVLFLPRVARLARAHDVVVVGDHSNALYCRFTGRTPTLLICHDLLAVRAAAGEFEGHRPGFAGRRLQAMIRASMPRADHIVCVSEATRRDVGRLIGTQRPTTVIENSLHHDYVPMAADERSRRLARFGLAGHRYFLHVGGNQWYKNRAGVVSLFSALAGQSTHVAYRLVFAGKALEGALAARIDESGLRDRVDFIETPDNRDLNALYAGAEALLFPSLHEGFGWPIVEAQAAGCAVVTTDRAPMRDVAGPGGAVLVDPADAAGAAAAYARAHEQLDAYRRQGHRNVARLDRRALAKAYRAVVDRLVERGS